MENEGQTGDRRETDGRRRDKHVTARTSNKLKIDSIEAQTTRNGPTLLRHSNTATWHEGGATVHYTKDTGGTGDTDDTGDPPEHGTQLHGTAQHSAIMRPFINRVHDLTKHPAC